MDIERFPTDRGASTKIDKNYPKMSEAEWETK